MILLAVSRNLLDGILYHPLDGPYIRHVLQDDPDDGLIDLVRIAGDPLHVRASQDYRRSGPLVAVLEDMVDEDRARQERGRLEPVPAPSRHADDIVQAALIDELPAVELLIYGDDILFAEHAA